MTTHNDVRTVGGTMDSVTAEISRSSPWMRRTVRLETDAGPLVIEVGGEYDDVQFIIGSPAALPVHYVNGFGPGERLWFAWNLDREIEADGSLETEYETIASEIEVVAAEGLDRSRETVAA